MTNKQTKEQFVIALNTNAYLGMCEAADMVNAIKALEKQIPKKPTNLSGRFWGQALSGLCPNCKAQANSMTHRYCRHCGQALDWSDTE